MSLDHSFGAWLENFRKERKLTQEKLASQLNYSAEYIRKLEADRRPPTDEVAKRLAEIQGLQGSESQTFEAHVLSGRLPASKPAAGEADPLLTHPAESADPAPGEPPYKGLSFFDEQDAHLYFGRQMLVNELLTLLAQVYNSPSRLLAVIGGSGSGKSSLVRAGLLPALRQGQKSVNPVHFPPDSQHWLFYVITPTAHPLESLAARLTQGSESVTATSTLIDDLGEDFRTLHLYARRLVGADNRLLLVIDQFEELFALCKDKQERSALIENLLYAVKGDGVTTVVLTLRADFYRYCLDYESLRLLLEQHTKTIGAMSRDELQTAIVGPAQANGWKFKAGLVDLFLDDVGDEPGALPLLAHALRETWERREGHTLTLAGYSHIGRVQGAIATTADRTLNRLTERQRQIAKNIFLRLTELGDGAEDTRRRVRFAELLPAGGDPHIVQQVLRVCLES